MRLALLVLVIGLADLSRLTVMVALLTFSILARNLLFVFVGAALRLDQHATGGLAWSQSGS